MNVKCPPPPRLQTTSSRSSSCFFYLVQRGLVKTVLSVGNLLFWNKAESTSKEAEREKANEIEGRSSQGGEAPPALIIIYQATTFFWGGGGFPHQWDRKYRCTSIVLKKWPSVCTPSPLTLITKATRPPMTQRASYLRQKPENSSEKITF